MEALKELQVIMVGDPQLRAAQEDGQNDGSIHTNPGAFFHVLAVPDLFLQSAESTVCLWQSVVNLVSVLASDEMAHPR